MARQRGRSGRCSVPSFPNATAATVFRVIRAGGLGLLRRSGECRVCDVA
jgi:hypothetical protein